MTKIALLRSYPPFSPIHMDLRRWAKHNKVDLLKFKHQALEQNLNCNMTTRSRKLAEADATGDYHPLPEISLTEHTTCVDLNLDHDDGMLCRTCVTRLTRTKRWKSTDDAEEIGQRLKCIQPWGENFKDHQFSMKCKLYKEIWKHINKSFCVMFLNQRRQNYN